MKDISNSPDFIPNRRFVNTPNILTNIRATSTPQSLGIKFISPNASPVCFSTLNTLDKSIKRDFNSHIRPDSPTNTVNKDNYAIKSNKRVFDFKLSYDENVNCSPILVKNNKKCIYEASKMLSSESQGYYKLPLSTKLTSCTKSKNDIRFQDHVPNYFEVSHSSVVMDSEMESQTNVDISMGVSVCMDSFKSHICQPLQLSNIIVEPTDAVDNVINMTEGDMSSDLLDIENNFCSSNKNNCKTQGIIENSSEIMESYSNSQQSYLQEHSNSNMNSSDILIPTISIQSNSILDDNNKKTSCYKLNTKNLTFNWANQACSNLFNRNVEELSSQNLIEVSNDNAFTDPNSILFSHLPNPLAKIHDTSGFMLQKVALTVDKSVNGSLDLHYPSFEAKHLSYASMGNLSRLSNFSKYIDNDISVPEVNDITEAVCHPEKQVDAAKIKDEETDETNWEDFCLEQPSNLISDFSRPYCLPYLKNGKHADLKAIDSETVCQIFNGNLVSLSRNLIIVDCRYPYEYLAGHIMNAVNCYKFSDLLNIISTIESTEIPIIIFYCEFSSKRAPKMLRQLRKWDRWCNSSHYPRLTFPELYIIEGGYQNAFSSSPIICTLPLTYVLMLDARFGEELKFYEALVKEEKTQKCKQELKRIFDKVRQNRKSSE